ncbi:MAG: P-loop NTPase [Spirochaetia bacterium]|jgi:flagellar biosynthesis protein FlhG
MVILPIGSGKGGVGKSLLATNLAVALAETGRKVVLADLDLGASNAHTMLGIRTVSRGIGTFLSLPRMKFEDIVLPTEYDGLSFIPGDADIPGIANLKAAQKRRLTRCLEALQADYLVLDLGPGAGANTLDFFLLSACGIVVTTPALTAILNAYLFLKNVVFRLMYATVDKGSGALGVLEEMRRDPGGLQKAYVPRIMEKIGAVDMVSHAKLSAVLDRLKPRLVLNMLEDPADADKMEKLRRSAREYLGIELAHLGVIYRDELQGVALGSRIPIVRYKPGSVLSRAVYRISDKIVSAPPVETANEGWPAPPETAESDDAGFQAAESEAESDFQAMRRDLEDLLHSGALTTGDLVEAVRTQQLELATLRRENAILRARLLRAVREGARA